MTNSGLSAQLDMEIVLRINDLPHLVRSDFKILFQGKFGQVFVLGDRPIGTDLSYVPAGDFAVEPFACPSCIFKFPRRTNYIEDFMGELVNIFHANM